MDASPLLFMLLLTKVRKLAFDFTASFIKKKGFFCGGESAKVKGF